MLRGYQPRCGFRGSRYAPSGGEGQFREPYSSFFTPLSEATPPEAKPAPPERSDTPS
jgi:hypothetical protein